MKARTILLIAAAVTASFALGYFLKGKGPQEQPGEAKTEAEEEVWICSMHPQIRRSKPGKCPICGMDLVRVEKDKGDAAEGLPVLTLSPYARKLAEIEVAPVERRYVSVDVRMVGKIQYDETRLGYVTAWVPGRLDRLYVDFTGQAVKRGDKMVYIYSPELLTAQRELLEAIRAVEELERSDLPIMKETASLTVEAVREKLHLWGVTKEQIEEIERTKTPSDHMTIYAPMGGIVIHKNALEGMYVNTGTRIYTVADLSVVWVVLDAYESDLTWIKYGQEVEFTTEAYPGEVFKGKISFVDPFMIEKTRTVKVRVNAPNADGRLKPEMFVHGIVRAKVAEGGRVVAPELAGKWISPKHPEIVKDEPGTCDICGVPLVRAEALSYASEDAQAPLVIPASAPLITGKRAVVYVEIDEGKYEGREVVLGPRAGDYYIVKEGLKEGELVVVNGNFKIDSALQILARPSMMSPEGGAPAPAHRHGAMGAPDKTVAEARVEMLKVPEAFKGQLGDLFSVYFEIQQALSQDKYEEARNLTKKFVGSLDAVDMKLLEGDAHMAWMKELNGLRKSAQAMTSAKNIEGVRSGFATLSESMAVVAKKFGTAGKQPVLRFHCPMKFDGRGADWLQNKLGVANPYYGSEMFKCGEQVEVIHPAPAERKATENE